jgi:hypothetical protein
MTPTTNTPAASATPAASTGCRVHIVNHITGRTTDIETSRLPLLVWRDLAKLVRYVNRRRDKTLRASLHFLQDSVVLHWHTPEYWADELAKNLLEVSQPLYDAEKLILEGSKKGVA